MQERNLSLDGLKFVAATLIVLIHVAAIAKLSYAQGTPASVIVNVGYSALFFFFAVAGYLHGPVGDRGRRWVGRRFTRLAVPYAAWSALYVAFHVCLAFAFHRAPTIPSIGALVFFAGAEEVLWSLPMLFYAAVLAELVAKNSASRRVAILVSAIAAITLVFVTPQSWIPQIPVYFALAPQWILVYLLGMEVRAGTDEVTEFGFAYVAAASGAALALGITAFLPQVGAAAAWTALAIRTLDCVMAYVVLRAAASGSDRLGVSRLAGGGQYLLGIYVSHYLFVEIWTALMRKHTAMPILVWIGLGWVFCLALALGTSMVLMRSRLLRATVS